MREKRY